MTQLLSPEFERYGVTVWMKREELNHPLIQGNKWHKLKLNIEAALKVEKKCLLTFGGAYSNHIAATAAAAKFIGLGSIGIIRGQELADQPEKWSHTLIEAVANGMQLEFISRADYRDKASPLAIQQLQQRYPDAYLIPEGGSNELAVRGFDHLLNQIETQCPDWSHLITAVGTGGTLAGLTRSAPIKDNRQIYGIPVLKQGDFLLPAIQSWIDNQLTNDWQLFTEYHCGGYAKTTPDLLKRMQQFETEFGIKLDPVYTAKMVNAVYELLSKKQFKPGSKIVLLHTGGLQGCSAKI